MSDLGAPTQFYARVQSRRGDTLAEFMSSIRIWLDRRRIDLVGFAPIPVTHGIVAFDVYFRNEQDVVLFQQEFGRRRVSRTPLSSNDRFPDPLLIS